MQIISTHSLSLGVIARAESGQLNVFIALAVCLWPLVSIVCLPLGDKTRDRREPCNGFCCVSASVCAHQIIAEQTDNLAATTPVLQARPHK